MDFLNIKISLYVKDHYINSYHCSVIKDEEGNLNGYGEDDNHHSYLSVQGKLKEKNLFLTVSYNENKIKDGIPNREIFATLGREYYFSEDPQYGMVGRSYYYGKTLDDYEIDVGIKITDVKKYIDSKEHRMQFVKER